MQTLIYSIILELLLLSGANSLEGWCSFDADCFLFHDVRYLNGRFHSDVWRRQDHQASGKSTYMYIPMGFHQRDVEAYLRTPAPLREDGVHRCLSFMYKTTGSADSTGFPDSRIQVQIWPDERPTNIDILFSAPSWRHRSGYWQEAIVDIPGSTSGYLVIDGFQKTYSSQVFLDDVIILQGQCHKSRPYPEFPQPSTSWYDGWTTRRYELTTHREPITTPPLINDIFFKLAGPYFTNNFNDDQWQRTLINLIPKLTLSTAQWSRRVGYPPELGIVAPYNAERGNSMSLSVGLNYLSPPPYSKAFLMTSYKYAGDGQDRCLTLDYIQHQESGNLGTIGIYMASYFLASDMFMFNARMDRLYKYPREGTYVYNSSPYWKSLEVTIPGSRTGHVFIQGVSGTGKGMIAVDNVSVSPGKCPNPNLL